MSRIDDSSRGALAVAGFTVTPTGETGFHTGRPRYRVVCDACCEEVHESTTVPESQARYHRCRATVETAVDALVLRVDGSHDWVPSERHLTYGESDEQRLKRIHEEMRVISNGSVGS